MIAESPALGERQDQIKQGLRRFVVGRYLIFYEPIAGGIRVVRSVARGPPLGRRNLNSTS